MSLQTLKSAAHAAGYAMAAEDLPEPRPEPLRPVPRSHALVVRTRRPVSLRVLKATRYLRRLWQRDWLGAAWTGRAPA